MRKVTNFSHSRQEYQLFIDFPNARKTQNTQNAPIAQTVAMGAI